MITKKYLKSKPLCKVTFAVQPEEHQGAENIRLVGDFNEWQIDGIEMKRTKQGKFSATLDLETGKEYQFRYLLDEQNWQNDWAADAYVPNNLTFEENSVVSV